MKLNDHLQQKFADDSKEKMQDVQLTEKEIAEWEELFKEFDVE